MESLVKILGAFIDTLVLNIYPTDHDFEIEERRVDEHLQEELMLLKGQAQEIEEDVPTRFAFNGAPLLMRALASVIDLAIIVLSDLPFLTAFTFFEAEARVRDAEALLDLEEVLKLGRSHGVDRLAELRCH